METGIHMNPLRIQTQYLLNSQAAGGLFSFLFITDNSVINFTKSTYLCLEKNTSQSYVLPFTQSPERYEISAYDIEEDGLLYSGEAYPATTSTHHDISGPGMQTQCIDFYCTAWMTYTINYRQRNYIRSTIMTRF